MYQLHFNKDAKNKKVSKRKFRSCNSPAPQSLTSQHIWNKAQYPRWPLKPQMIWQLLLFAFIT